LIAADARLIRQVELHAAWTRLPWDPIAAEAFDRCKALRVRTGTQDLRIASIVMSRNATLLTRNTRDFAHVPGLRFENWLD